jgi:cellulose synthase/poly-beta-1,6-N-acetylglucosamine synthase-like glycosyltransferase
MGPLRPDLSSVSQTDIRFGAPPQPQLRAPSSHAGQARARDFIRPARTGIAQAQTTIAPINTAPSAEAPPLPLEIGFLTAYGMPVAVLADVARHARAQGVSADVALIALGYMHEVSYYKALAAYVGVPFVEHNVPLAAHFDVREAIAAGLVPLAGEGGAQSSYLVAPRGEQVQTLLHFRRRGPAFIGRICLTTPRLLAAHVRAHAHYAIRHHASFALQEWNAQLTAGTPTTLAQRFLLILALALALASIALGATSRLVFSLAFSFMLIYVSVLRLFAAAVSGEERAHAHRPIAENQFPTYTILVPLYREAAVLSQLISHLDRLDYPRAKLDIKLLIEADDQQTLEALSRIKLAPIYDVIIVPNGQPRTKPRALNVGLMFARGEMLVVYDAEDVPAPDQLRRAALRFAREPYQVACLQARLAIDNYKDSWLAGTFALEYAALFDVLLPGLVELGLPIPLGGTSNHFRTQVLRDLRGWDAWNVTEDADFGLRLARFGYRVETLNSSTYEEAPAHARAWVQQRQRWLKGWVQTLFVLSRQPLVFLRQLKLISGLSTLVFLCSGVFGPLLAPLFSILFIHDLIYSFLLEPTTIVEITASTMWCFLLFTGLLSSGTLLYLGMKRRGLSALWTIIPALLLRQCLLSYAASSAIFDFIRRPYYWSKTTHGLARTILRPSSKAQHQPQHQPHNHS